MCIDTGYGSASTPAFDVDGEPRSVDANPVGCTGGGTSPCVDMGAYEYQDG